MYRDALQSYADDKLKFLLGLSDDLTKGKMYGSIEL